MTPAAIMQLGMAFLGSKTLLSAVELGVFSELASAGALDSDTLRKRLGLHPRSTRDFLDALVALGMLEREDGRYANTPATDLFLDRAKPSYMGGILEMGNARLYGFWGSLTEGLRTGLPQNEAKGGGKNIFELIYSDPVKLAQFARAMSAISADTARVIAAKFPWQEHRSVIDIGCAEGAVPVQIALAHEHITGGGFDLPALGSDLRRLRRGLRAQRAGCASPPAISSPTTAPDGCARDGPHPARLGPRQEATVGAQGLRRPARGRGAHRLRCDHRRRAAQRTHSAC